MDTGHNADGKTFYFKLDDELGGAWDRCEDFLAEVKDRIPSADREYDPEEKVWTINSDWLPVFEDIRERHFGDPSQQELL